MGQGERRFKDLSEPELREKCAAAMLEWAANTEEASLREFRDCESEYLLRGLSFPPKGKDIDRAIALLAQKADAAD